VVHDHSSDGQYECLVFRYGADICALAGREAFRQRNHLRTQ
jgi:hypothetical protein